MCENTFACEHARARVRARARKRVFMGVNACVRVYACVRLCIWNWPQSVKTGRISSRYHAPVGLASQDKDFQVTAQKPRNQTAACLRLLVALVEAYLSDLEADGLQRCASNVVFGGELAQTTDDSARGK